VTKDDRIPRCVDSHVWEHRKAGCMLGREAEQVPARYALVNGRVILPNRVVEDHAVVVADGRILEILDTGSLDRAVPQVDVAGRYIGPGLIDIHSHGALGHTFNEPTAEAFSVITGENLSRGVTGMMATIATAPLRDMIECLRFTQEWMKREQQGSRILGAHVEGPYFNLEQAGAQDPANIRTPDDGSVEALLEFADTIRIMTFAPELSGALALTRRLAELGIVAAAGHSSARDSDVREAMQAGLRHAIHLWSGQSSTIRQGPWRKPGLLEACLTFDGLTAEIIADNKHLPPTLMKLAFKCLGPDRLCVVSDATSGAGLAEGARFRMGEMEYEVHDGVGMLFDRTAFAGSTTLVDEMIPILVEEVGVPLAEAVRMASLTPARVIGVGERKGSLEAGKDADIAILNADMTAWRTIIGGRWATVRPS
jgi:N-acetylglucosamine-6-phosphate deacetylase